jgi:UDP-N-acetylglucosamine 2-epimerase (non-hydrolysing)/GDP/UDP-N,N'-diacetylbacillosamine 2-epimerase (hydrolysing)
MERITDDSELSLQLFVTGMHLVPTHGKTISEIKSDGFIVDYEIEMNMHSDSGVSMGKSLGIGTMGFSEGFRNLEPDIVLVLGDRSEPFAATIAAAHMNIPVAHIGGGHVSGGAVIDAHVRHAISKLSHLHFATSRVNATRISKLGEERWRIFSVGAPGLDDIHEGKYTQPNEVYEKYNIPHNKPVVVMLQHPTTTRPGEGAVQVRETLAALQEISCHPFIIYPNSDAGSNDVIEMIKAESESFNSVTVTQNVPRAQFLGLLNICDAMVGNSSSGLIEAPSFNVPVVNVGPRQQGRERAKNVIDAPYERKDIKNALERALTDEAFQEVVNDCENPFFMGGAASQIYAKLKEVDIDRNLLEKSTSL